MTSDGEELEAFAVGLERALFSAYVSAMLLLSVGDPCILYPHRGLRVSVRVLRRRRWCDGSSRAARAYLPRRYVVHIASMRASWPAVNSYMQASSV